jgi:hypothetical protein
LDSLSLFSEPCITVHCFVKWKNDAVLVRNSEFIIMIYFYGGSSWWLMSLTSSNKPNVTRTHYPDSEARRVWRYQREVIRIRKSKKDRQHNGQRKKNKGAFVKWNISIWDIYSVAVNQSLPLLHYSRGTKYQPIILSMDWLLNILFVFL